MLVMIIRLEPIVGITLKQDTPIAASDYDTYSSPGVYTLSDFSLLMSLGISKRVAGFEDIYSHKDAMDLPIFLHTFEVSL
jgi:hypothetical protein